MKKSETSEILEMVTFIKEKVEELPTKDDVRSMIREEVPSMIRKEVPDIVREQTDDIRNELSSIRSDLKELKRQSENSTGLTKEIDHALARIRVIEKRLGIKSASA